MLQLEKINAVTLLSWLRENRVPCKAKDKKQELIDKVKLFLVANHTEQ